MSEEVTECIHAVTGRLEVSVLLRHLVFRLPIGLCLLSKSLHLGGCRKINPPVVTLSDHGHQTRSHPTSLCLGANMLVRDWHTRKQADKTFTLSGGCAAFRRLDILRLADLHRKSVAVTLDDRLDICLLSDLR